MLSPEAKDAIRDQVIAVLADVRAAVPVVDPDRVYWAETDLDAGTQPKIVIEEIGSESLGLDGEVVYQVREADPEADPPVERALLKVTRETHAVTISITAVVQRSASAPTHAEESGVLARLLSVRLLRRESVHRAWDAAGCPLLRRGALRDLKNPRRGSMETRSTLELVLGCAVIDIVEVGWIETTEGEGTITLVEGVDVDPDDPIAVVPFSAES